MVTFFAITDLDSCCWPSTRLFIFCACMQGRQCSDVEEVNEGNDIEAILTGLAEAKSLTGKGKPICILLYTEMGNGVDFMMHTHAWHGKAPNDEQLEIALSQNPETLGDY